MLDMKMWNANAKETVLCMSKACLKPAAAVSEKAAVGQDPSSSIKAYLSKVLKAATGLR